MECYNDLERALWGWAKWEIALRKGEVGFPIKSIAAGFQDGSMGLRKEFGSVPLIKDDTALSVSLWIFQMGVVYPEYRDSIYYYYLTRKKIREIASDLSISARTFKQRLHDAKLWLEGRLTAYSDTPKH